MLTIKAKRFCKDRQIFFIEKALLDVTYKSSKVNVFFIVVIFIFFNRLKCGKLQ